MKNIALRYAAGMPTNMLVQRMQDAVQRRGVEVSIKAVPIAEFKDNLAAADIILLGPQVKYEQAKLQALTDPSGKKVAVIDMINYGMVKGDAVLDKALKILEQSIEDLETIIMELLVNTGSARSAALTALQLAREGDFTAAEQAMAESHELVKHAHKIQTQLIGLDKGTGKLPVSLITIHSQDRLMNAMVTQDLATDMIELYRRLPLTQ